MNIEIQSDLLLSTMRSNVEAMGGKLRLTVEFPDFGTAELEGLGDTEWLPSRQRGVLLHPSVRHALF